MAAYRRAATDQDLAGLLCLFGSTEAVVTRWRRQGETVYGFDEAGAEKVRVPMREPVFVRPAFDPRLKVLRTNCP